MVVSGSRQKVMKIIGLKSFREDCWKKYVGLFECFSDAINLTKTKKHGGGEKYAAFGFFFLSRRRGDQIIDQHDYKTEIAIKQSGVLSFRWLDIHRNSGRNSEVVYLDSL